MKRTPLYETHVKLGARMVPFAGAVLGTLLASGGLRNPCPRECTNHRKTL